MTPAMQVSAILARVEQERASSCATCGLRGPAEDGLCSPCAAAARELAEERALWAGEPAPERIPSQNPDDIAASVEINSTIRQYGRSLVAGDDAVAALRDLEAAAANIRPVETRYLYADTWARFAQYQLPAYAAIVLAHRLLNDRRVGCHVLKHLLASRVVLAPLGPGEGGRHDILDTSAVWKELAETAWHFLFNYDEAARFNSWGRIVQNVLGRRRQTGRNASVGLWGWQRRKLRQLADPSRSKTADTPTSIFTSSEAAAWPGTRTPTTPSGWPRTRRFGCWPRASGGRRASCARPPCTGSKRTASRRSGTIRDSRASTRTWCSTRRLVRTRGV